MFNSVPLLTRLIWTKAQRDNKLDSKNQPNSTNVQRCDLNLLSQNHFQQLSKSEDFELHSEQIFSPFSLTWILISRTKEIGEKKAMWQRPLPCLSPRQHNVVNHCRSHPKRENHGSTNSDQLINMIHFIQR